MFKGNGENSSDYDKRESRTSVTQKSPMFRESGLRRFRSDLVIRLYLASCIPEIH